MNENYSKAMAIRQYIDATDKRYIWNDHVRESFTVMYERMSNEKRLFYFANERFGSVSDCFIIYAIMILGVCDILSIQNFLHALHNMSTELSLLDYEDLSSLRSRIKKLVDVGFLAKNVYRTEGVTEDKSTSYMNLYSCTSEAVEFATKRLSRPYKFMSWLQAMRPQELISWAAASRIGTTLALYPTFKEFGLGKVYSNKNSYYLPCELKYQLRDTEYNVAVMNTFLYFDKSVMTESDYKDYVIDKLNTILQYVTYRSKVCEARVVCVVEDNTNLTTLAKWIKKAERLRDILPALYFTGEGVVNELNGDVANSMVQLVLSDRYEAGFTFVQTVPDFLG